MRSKLRLLSIFTLMALLSSTGMYAQNTTTDANAAAMARKKKIKPIHSELSAGLRLNTDGWSIFVDKGWVKSDDRKKDLFYDVKLLQIEFSEKKHPKERKASNDEAAIASQDASPFIYGKVNNFYSLKLGYGGRKMIAGKLDQGAVSIHAVYVAGLSVGLLKPYYIDAYVMEPGSSVFTPKAIKYEDDTKEPFLTKRYIIGSSGFSEGLSELSIKPGVHAKAGFHFDFAVARTSKLAVETGVSIEYYFSKIQLMANQTERSYFGNLYMSFQIGKRWPKKK